MIFTVLFMTTQPQNTLENTHPLLQPLTIGCETVSNRIWLAPMAGVTDNPFRRLCKSFGVGHTISEMMTSMPHFLPITKRCIGRILMARLLLYLPKLLAMTLLNLLSRHAFKLPMVQKSLISTWAVLPKKSVINWQARHY